MNNLNELLLSMAEFHYRQHYKEKISQHLNKEQKNDIIHRISDLTLERAIWEDRDTDYKTQFPELEFYISKQVPLSGLYLCAIMKEIFQEINPETAKNIGVYQKGFGELDRCIQYHKPNNCESWCPQIPHCKEGKKQ